MPKAKLNFAIVLATSTWAIGSTAKATCPVPYTLTNGQVADAAQVMDNFNAIGNCDSTGVENPAVGIGHSTGSTSARSILVHIVNTKGAVKLAQMHNNTGVRTLFVASPSDINAVRINNTTGGNITAGSLIVLGR